MNSGLENLRLTERAYWDLNKAIEKAIRWLGTEIPSILPITDAEAVTTVADALEQMCRIKSAAGENPLDPGQPAE